MHDVGSDPAASRYAVAFVVLCAVTNWLSCVLESAGAVVNSGSTLVLAGVVLGLTESAAVGVLVFKLQATLPCREGADCDWCGDRGVSITMMCNTVHVMQAIDWLLVNSLPGVSFPSWMGSGWACS